MPKPPSSYPQTPTLPGEPLDFGRRSCEQLANRLVDAVTARYGRHRAVLEGGLLGRGVDWQPDPDHR